MTLCMAVHVLRKLSYPVEAVVDTSSERGMSRPALLSRHPETERHLGAHLSEACSPTLEQACYGNQTMTSKPLQCE